MLVGGVAIVWLAPNTRELIEQARLRCADRELVTIGAASLGIFLLSAISASRHLAEFIYFNF